MNIQNDTIKIENILNDLYEEIEKLIHHDVCCYACKIDSHKAKCKFEVILDANRKTTKDLFYEHLDKLLTALGEEADSAEYYKNFNFIDFNAIDEIWKQTDIEKYNCTSKESNAFQLKKNKLDSTIVKFIPVTVIAEMVVYKKFFQNFDEEWFEIFHHIFEDNAEYIKQYKSINTNSKTLKKLKNEMVANFETILDDSKECINKLIKDAQGKINDTITWKEELNRLYNTSLDKDFNKYKTQCQDLFKMIFKSSSNISNSSTTISSKSQNLISNKILTELRCYTVTTRYTIHSSDYLRQSKFYESALVYYGFEAHEKDSRIPTIYLPFLNGFHTEINDSTNKKFPFANFIKQFLNDESKSRIGSVKDYDDLEFFGTLYMFMIKCQILLSDNKNDFIDKLKCSLQTEMISEYSIAYIKYAKKNKMLSNHEKLMNLICQYGLN